MTEEQLRDILARVVPEPPDSVADPAAMVRAARTQQRARTVVVTSVAGVLVASTLLGVRALSGDRDAPDPGVAEDSSALADPYSTAPCPAVNEEWTNTPLADLGEVTAVRYCARPSDQRYPSSQGPVDALVVGLDAFADEVDGIPEADPGRCGANAPAGSDDRLLLQLNDGTFVGVAASPCQDAVVDGRTIDGGDLRLAFIAALRSQRDAHEYSPSEDPAPLGCESPGDISPVMPGAETLVDAVVCSSSEHGDTRTQLDAEAVAELDEAWAAAEQLDAEEISRDQCRNLTVRTTTIRARTDRGDMLSIGPSGTGCDAMGIASWLLSLPVDRPAGWLVQSPTYRLQITVQQLTD